MLCPVYMGPMRWPSAMIFYNFKPLTLWVFSQWFWGIPSAADSFSLGFPATCTTAIGLWMTSCLKLPNKPWMLSTTAYVSLGRVLEQHWTWNWYMYMLVFSSEASCSTHRPAFIDRGSWWQPAPPCVFRRQRRLAVLEKGTQSWNYFISGKGQIKSFNAKSPAPWTGLLVVGSFHS